MQPFKSISKNSAHVKMAINYKQYSESIHYLCGIYSDSFQNNI